ncbi:hypothetical protein HBZC1_p0640 (plasmid) [Helicobacter bizzozeronii CIII-1]|uniref:Uncharacterized protein n=1 Tax=Helicobacter bizzozeronii (strain CIII-1) TaxID=1002804 RepID=F8KUK9_HELBC|nr:hypothetical protein HBZC1_p0640 [Helicobacter bizzozeronii CIII-1]
MGTFRVFLQNKASCPFCLLPYIVSTHLECSTIVILLLTYPPNPSLALQKRSTAKYKAKFLLLKPLLGVWGGVSVP